MMPEPRVTITVDGTAASGKSALAAALAKHFGFKHLNSGLLYRAAGHLAIEAMVSLIPDTPLSTSFLAALEGQKLELRASAESECEVWLNGKCSSVNLHTAEIAQAASIVAADAGVRRVLLPSQRTAFPGAGIVAEGRDMGTVVFPTATAKFFVDADVSVRAKRRAMQRGGSASLEETVAELLARDHRDRSRTESPMVVSPDAVLIDNSELPFEAVLDQMVRVVKERL